jgi:hypothetical protein
LDLYEELLGLVDVLASARIDYAICGGIAVAFHGYSRFTKDIDLLVPREDLERIRQAVGTRGFTLSSGPMPFDVGGPGEREIHRITKVDRGEHLTLDLLLVSPTLQSAWDQREIYEWQGRYVQIVSAEGLAHMKRLAKRDQDILDLKKLGFSDDE